MAALPDHQLAEFPSTGGHIEPARPIVGELAAPADGNAINGGGVEHMGAVGIGQAAAQPVIETIERHIETVAVIGGRVDALAPGVVGAELERARAAGDSDLERVVIRAAVVRADDNTIELREVAEVKVGESGGRITDVRLVHRAGGLTG